MIERITSLVAALAFMGWATVANATAIYSFSFDNVLGTVAGTVEGTITLDFISSPFDSGSGMASEIMITSAPAAIPPSIEGDIATDWMTQALNTFTVVNGAITDYQFGASEGAIPALADNVLCLNNGGFFVVGGVYVCGAQENYLGDAFNYVYNTDGIGGVRFDVEFVPEPATLAIFSLGLAGLGFSMRRKV